MPADDELVRRVREALRRQCDISERRMFGGVAFLVDGNMCCGVTKDLLVLRLGTRAVALALKEPHTREMNFTGKTMKTMVYVEAPGVRADPDLQTWIQRAVRFVRTLPPKRTRKVRRD